LGLVTAGFRARPLIDAGVMTAGALGNIFITNTIARQFPAAWSPQARSAGGFIAGLGSAGLFLLIPKFGSRLFAGALAYRVSQFIAEKFPQVTQAAAGTRGMGYDDLGDDIPELSEFATQRELPDGSGIRGMDEFATAGNVSEEELAGVDLSE
jgi:hypothetical protein